MRDHCHLTGKYRGAAHNSCNLRMRTPEFVPVLFHNLEGYDSHLFIKSLGLSGEKIRCIPKTDEKYISFSKDAVMETIIDKEGEKHELTLEIRFLDSLKFTLKSLDSLVKSLGPDQFNTLEKEMGTSELLKKKGVFPYEFMTDFDKLNVNKLPSKKDFYSKLNDSNISDEDYEHAQKVWKEFKCETMRDYHDLYLKTDVLLLADIYARANNPYVNNFNPEEESVYIQYLDPNNLYGWAMSQPLPVNGFEWINETELQNWNRICNEEGKGCILEVDLEHPKKLHDAHNEYPLAPERLKINKVNKLIPNFNNKEKYEKFTIET